MQNDSEAVYWQIIAKMTPTQKLEALMNLYWTARQLKIAGLKMQYPELTDLEIQRKVRDIFLYATN